MSILYDSYDARRPCDTVSGCPVLTTKTTCPECSQNQRMTIDNLVPMVPTHDDRYGKIVMKCSVCGSVFQLPGKQ